MYPVAEIYWTPAAVTATNYRLGGFEKRGPCSNTVLVGFTGFPNLSTTSRPTLSSKNVMVP